MQTKTIGDKKEIAQIGTISANNDKTIGEIISESMEKVGKDGVITVEEAKGMETTLLYIAPWRNRSVRSPLTQALKAPL
ncbi:MAG TPA: hypothetical protein VJZ49_09050 [Syntrophales bacterium]|nr:hypothetical protein [Syntrophales bacterium]